MGLNQLTMRMSFWTLTVTALGAVTIRRSAVAAGPGPGMGEIWDWCTNKGLSPSSVDKNMHQQT